MLPELHQTQTQEWILMLQRLGRVSPRTQIQWRGHRTQTLEKHRKPAWRNPSIPVIINNNIHGSLTRRDTTGKGI